MCRLRPGEGRAESQAAALGEETDSKRAPTGKNEWSKKKLKLVILNLIRQSMLTAWVWRQCHLE